jgi:hypothetical protein
VRAKTKDEAEQVGKYIVRPGKTHKRFFFLGPEGRRSAVFFGGFLKRTDWSSKVKGV